MLASTVCLIIYLCLLQLQVSLANGFTLPFTSLCSQVVPKRPSDSSVSAIERLHSVSTRGAKPLFESDCQPLDNEVSSSVLSESINLPSFVSALRDSLVLGSNAYLSSGQPSIFYAEGTGLSSSKVISPGNKDMAVNFPEIFDISSDALSFTCPTTEPSLSDTYSSVFTSAGSVNHPKSCAEFVPSGLFVSNISPYPVPVTPNHDVSRFISNTKSNQINDVPIIQQKYSKPISDIDQSSYSPISNKSLLLSNTIQLSPSLEEQNIKMPNTFLQNLNIRASKPSPATPQNINTDLPTATSNLLSPSINPSRSEIETQNLENKSDIVFKLKPKSLDLRILPIPQLPFGAPLQGCITPLVKNQNSAEPPLFESPILDNQNTCNLSYASKPFTYIGITSPSCIDATENYLSSLTRTSIITSNQEVDLEKISPGISPTPGVLSLQTNVHFVLEHDTEFSQQDDLHPFLPEYSPNDADTNTAKCHSGGNSNFRAHLSNSIMTKLCSDTSEILPSLASDTSFQNITPSVAASSVSSYSDINNQITSSLYPPVSSGNVIHSEEKTSGFNQACLFNQMPTCLQGHTLSSLSKAQTAVKYKEDPDSVTFTRFPEPSQSTTNSECNPIHKTKFLPCSHNKFSQFLCNNSHFLTPSTATQTSAQLTDGISVIALPYKNQQEHIVQSGISSSNANMPNRPDANQMRFLPTSTILQPCPYVPPLVFSPVVDESSSDTSPLTNKPSENSNSIYTKGRCRPFHNVSPSKPVTPIALNEFSSNDNPGIFSSRQLLNVFSSADSETTGPTSSIAAKPSSSSYISGCPSLKSASPAKSDSSHVQSYSVNKLPKCQKSTTVSSLPDLKQRNNAIPSKNMGTSNLFPTCPCSLSPTVMNPQQKLVTISHNLIPTGNDIQPDLSNLLDLNLASSPAFPNLQAFSAISCPCLNLDEISSCIQKPFNNILPVINTPELYPLKTEFSEFKVSPVPDTNISPQIKTPFNTFSEALKATRPTQVGEQLKFSPKCDLQYSSLQLNEQTRVPCLPKNKLEKTGPFATQKSDIYNNIVYTSPTAFILKDDCLNLPFNSQPSTVFIDSTQNVPLAASSVYEVMDFPIPYCLQDDVLIPSYHNPSSGQSLSIPPVHQNVFMDILSLPISAVLPTVSELEPNNHVDQLTEYMYPVLEMNKNWGTQHIIVDSLPIPSLQTKFNYDYPSFDSNSYVIFEDAILPGTDTLHPISSFDYQSNLMNSVYLSDSFYPVTSLPKVSCDLFNNSFSFFDYPCVDSSINTLPFSSYPDYLIPSNILLSDVAVPVVEMISPSDSCMLVNYEAYPSPSLPVKSLPDKLAHTIINSALSDLTALYVKEKSNSN